MLACSPYGDVNGLHATPINDPSDTARSNTMTPTVERHDNGIQVILEGARHTLTPRAALDLVGDLTDVLFEVAAEGKGTR